MNEQSKSRPRTKRTLSNEEVIRLYNMGKRTEDIAKKANVSARYIRMILKKENISKRPHGSWKRRYTVNEDYFKTWSNNMAYILGFFAADGTVPKDIQSISIAQKEKRILEKIKLEMKSNHPIIQSKTTKIYILTLNSKIMKTDIMELHNIKPKKSLDLKFPHVPKQYLSHFVRGYFDGDGCIYEQKEFVNIVGGSLNFMESLFDILVIKRIEPIFKSFDTHYRLYISGYENVKRFSDWIYKDKGLYLERKYIRFTENRLSEIENK